MNKYVEINIYIIYNKNKNCKIMEEKEMNSELQTKLTKKRWAVLIASCLINLCIGSIYAWSVFVGPMAEHLTGTTGIEFTAGTLAIVFTVANSVGPITMISGGFINDRLGPRWAIFIGGIMFGAGMLLSGFATNLPMLLVGYGLGCGLGMGMVYGCTISNSVKFFPDKRGLIGGIATASYGISSVLVPLLATRLMNAFEVTGAFKIFGIAFLIIICGGAFVIEKCPEGFLPTGFQPPEAKANGQSAVVNKNWAQMLRDPAFYIMIVMLMCGATFGMMMISQASPIAQNMIGMSANAAAVVVSVLALFNAAGRVLAGYISDLIGRIHTLMVMLVLAVVALLLLSNAGEGAVVQFYIGVSIIGLCFGSFMGVFPGFTADQFGPKNNSVNYGIMFIGFAAAGYFGPTIISKIYANSGSYSNAFMVAMVLAVLGLLLSIVYKLITAKKQK